MKKPYWFNVLNHFERHNYVNNGLTIPFLIGARKIIEPWETLFTLPDFFNSVYISNISITIMKCRDINEYIIGLLDPETEITINKNPKSYNIVGNVVITDNSFNGITEGKKIVSILEAEYGRKIVDGNYSKNLGAWGNFSEIEQNRIREITL